MLFNINDCFSKLKTIMTSKSSKLLSKTSDDNYVLAKDVKKVGFMKKLKTLKKKYFVLRDHSGGHESSLSYYDNEKKFRTNVSLSKRVIYLKDCFSINRKMDGKHKYVIALYTKDECFATIVDTETQFTEWLEALIDLQVKAIDPKDFHYINYDHVWQVYINKNGLGQTRNMTGVHRFCLTANTLFIVKVDPQVDCPEVYDLPLISIRRCGHTSSTFFIDLGRSSSIGPGELWIQAEDCTIAQNMHEVILNSMKSSKSHEEFGPQRPRSASTSDKPISSRRPQTLANQNVLPFGPVSQSYSLSTSSSVSTSSVSTICSIRERCDSMPSRSRLSSESENHESKPWTSCHYHTTDRLHSGLYNRTLSYSPPSHNPLSPSSCACSTDSAGSSLSIDDFENHAMPDHYSGIHSSLVPSEPPISEEEAQNDDYLSMEPNSSSSNSHPLRSNLNLSFRSTNTLNISPLTSPTLSSVKSLSQSVREETSPYMPMSPVGSVGTESLCSSRRSSGLDKHPNLDVSSEYVPMVTGQEPRDTNIEEYLNMAPLSASIEGSESPNNTIQEEYHLEKVRSYFSPTEEIDSLDYIKPVRAYSIGSRPQLKTNSSNKRSSKSKHYSALSGTQSQQNDDEIRMRAFSMGSHANSREARVTAKKNELFEKQIGGPNIPIEETNKCSKKASSAPILSPSVPRLRSATVGSRPVFNRPNARDRSDTDLMEIDYSKSVKDKLIDEKMKRSAVGHRQRSNSRSSTSSSGIGSTTTTSPSITSSMNELNEKKKDHLSDVTSLNTKCDDESLAQNNNSRHYSKENAEYLQVVMMNSNQETKLPSRPMPSKASPTVPSMHSSVQMVSHVRTLPINKSEIKAQFISELSGVRKHSNNDSGDYVCLDISSTNKVPQLSDSSMNTKAQNSVKSIHSLTEKPTTVDNFPVSQNQNIEMKNEKICIKEESKTCSLGTKQQSVPNTDITDKNVCQTSCPPKHDQPISLNTFASIFTNTQSQTSSKSPERKSIPNEITLSESKNSQKENSYENISLGSGSSSRPSSVSSEREINYASLDLPQSGLNNNVVNTDLCEEFKNISPRPLKSPNQLSLISNILTSPSGCTTTVTPIIACGSQELLNSSVDSSCLLYAEIDFKKSEGLRNAASTGRK